MAVPLIAEAAGLIQQGKLSPLDLVEACLARIDSLEGRMGAWVCVDGEGARKAARELGEEIARGKHRGLLHGIPLGIKDIIDMAGRPTLAGSKTRVGHVAKTDAEVVARLRRAGAIFLGKTVTTEMASFDPPPTRNPWNLERTPGGSSSGSASATALGMCLGALGSQTGGSITRPASYCGVCGCKPTYGRVSVRGVLPLAYSMDHPGPIARSIEDLAILLQTIAGPDELDPFVAHEPVGNYLEAVHRFRGPPRLGAAGGFFTDNSDAEVRRLTQEALNLLREAGAEVHADSAPMDFAEINRLHRRIMSAEAAAYHQPVFVARRNDFGPKIAALIEEGLRLPAVDYATARKQQPVLRHEFLRSLGELDAFVTPATPTAAPGIDTTGDPMFNSPWSYLGLPTVSFPCGLTNEGLPAALQLVGRPFEEGPLLAVAAWCERKLAFAETPS